MDQNDLRRYAQTLRADPGAYYRLNEGQQTTASNALRVAAEKYTENAAIVRAELTAGNVGQDYERIAEQFDRQATEALELARQIEAGE